jgi:hypothetical protein
MEIYSPPRNYNQRYGSGNAYKPEAEKKKKDKDKKNSDPFYNMERESFAERMRRVFYERLRAFFEYEEVS